MILSDNLDAVRACLSKPGLFGGYCKVKTVSGFGELLPTEQPLLTKKEVAEGVRLSCQLKIKADVAIEIPEELFSMKEFK